MKLLKLLFLAFIIGGSFAVVGQSFLVAYSLLLGSDSMFVSPLTLLSVGIVGCLLFILGLYQKLERVTGFATALPFSGLSAAVAGAFLGARREGASFRQAASRGFKLALLVLGTGTIISAAIAVLAFFAS